MYWCPTSESERERGAKPGRHLLPLTWDPPSEAERKRGYSRLGVPLTDLDDAPKERFGEWKRKQQAQQHAALHGGRVPFFGRSNRAVQILAVVFLVSLSTIGWFGTLWGLADGTIGSNAGATEGRPGRTAVRRRALSPDSKAAGAGGGGRAGGVGGRDSGAGAVSAGAEDEELLSAGAGKRLVHLTLAGTDRRTRLLLPSDADEVPSWERFVRAVGGRLGVDPGDISRVETLLGEEVVSTDDLIDNDNLHVFTERRAAADSTGGASGGEERQHGTAAPRRPVGEAPAEAAPLSGGARRGDAELPAMYAGDEAVAADPDGAVFPRKAGRGGGGGRPEEKRLQRVREDEMMPPRRRAAQGTDRRATAAVEGLRAFGGDGQAR